MFNGCAFTDDVELQDAEQWDCWKFRPIYGKRSST